MPEGICEIGGFRSDILILVAIGRTFLVPFNLPDPRNFDTNAVLYIVVQLRTITEREEDFQVNEERSKD